MTQKELEDLIAELKQLADRANVAFDAGQHVLVEEFMQRAKQIAEQIEADRD